MYSNCKFCDTNRRFLLHPINFYAIIQACCFNKSKYFSNSEEINSRRKKIMFWTNIMKSLGKITVGLGVIVSVILGIVAGNGADNALVGLLVIVAGVVTAFIGVSGIMIICEISQNIADIRKMIVSQDSHLNH